MIAAVLAAGPGARATSARPAGMATKKATSWSRPRRRGFGRRCRGSVRLTEPAYPGCSAAIVDAGRDRLADAGHEGHLDLRVAARLCVAQDPDHIDDRVELRGLQ